MVRVLAVLVPRPLEGGGAVSGATVLSVSLAGSRNSPSLPLNGTWGCPAAKPSMSALMQRVVRRADAGRGALVTLPRTALLI